ncbi:MAG: c-type cytochrome [Limisphaerales bacterium]
MSLRISACLAVLLSALMPSRAADTAPIGLLGRPAHGVPAGEVLLGELNCVACHAPTPAAAARLSAKVGPRFGGEALRLTPQFLREYLANPAQVGAARAMPDVLHGLPAAAKADAVEALTHYLVSLPSAVADTPAEADPADIAEGRRLFHTVGCVACHAPEASPDEVFPHGARLGPAEFDALRLDSIRTSVLARKTTVAALAAFLRDPLKSRPSGRMPAVPLGEREAAALAAYLLRDQAAAGGGEAFVPGLRVEYFETRTEGRMPDFETLTAAARGVATNLSAAYIRRADHVALRFTGHLEAPADGEYTFWTVSDDGSQLYLDGRLVVDNAGEHGAVEKSGKVTLKAGRHPLRVTWFENAGGEELAVSWSGPGFGREVIPASRLSRAARPMRPLGETSFTVDAAQAARGRALFGSLGCASCHAVDDLAGAPTAPPVPALAALRANPAAGCLADEPPAGRPRFFLTAVERTALRETVAAAEKLETPLTPAQSVHHTLARLSCYACHARDGVGGPGDLRAAYFTTAGEADLGDEGRLPPALTRTGFKLRTAALGAILTNAAAARPYMAVRMPQFGAANVGHLPALFASADGGGTGMAPAFDATLAKHGRKLAGTGGLACVSCHTFGKFPSLGIPALDMTRMAGRLRWEWFDAYLRDPASLRPGTRMPAFWPEGRAVNTDVLDGDTARQIAALWHFLSRGAEAELPDGLVVGQMEIAPTNGPAIYRHFLEGAGTRAIGVGYPEKVNLAWDADQMRLALAWHGGFVDAAKHRTGRGEGFQGPLGVDVIKFPEGPPLARLAQPQDVWPAAAGADAGYRMRGYAFDAERRPVFRYEFAGLAVEDHVVPRTTELDASLRRTVTVRGDNAPGDVWLRVARAPQIVGRDSTTFLVNDRLTVRLGEGSRAQVVEAGGEKELRVPLRFRDGAAEIGMDFEW